MATVLITFRWGLYVVGLTPVVLRLFKIFLVRTVHGFRVGRARHSTPSSCVLAMSIESRFKRICKAARGAAARFFPGLVLHGQKCPKARKKKDHQTEKTKIPKSLRKIVEYAIFQLFSAPPSCIWPEAVGGNSLWPGRIPCSTLLILTASGTP